MENCLRQRYPPCTMLHHRHQIQQNRCVCSPLGLHTINRSSIELLNSTATTDGARVG